MNIAARQLFRDLADTPREERKRILADNCVPDELCAELESLFGFDSRPGESLTRRVHAVADVALCEMRAAASRRCGPYRLVRFLGSGGMGTVYLAERRDGEIEQRVAIKLLRTDADHPSWRDRFLKERQLLAYLNHPCIARLLDAGHTSDGWPYLAMEYVDGAAIDEYAARLDLRSQLKLFLLVCDGVSHAHRHLIVHRDLKPSNILVDPSGQPKLLDFGIAKLVDERGNQTRTIERLLTPNYASPEQRRGGVQTTATDIYSLGAVLYKLLTGRALADASAGIPEVDRTGRLNPELPRDIDCILRKALRLEPSERYGSVDAFADDVRAFLESKPVQARSGDIWYRTRKFLRRYRLALAATTLVIASLLLGLQIANHQRAIAQNRFQLVRQLASRVLVLDQAVGGLDNASNARQEIAAMSKEYLEALGAEARKDRQLALEVGDAYALLARVQGIGFDATSTQHAQAEESLRKADALVEPILHTDAHNRKALLIAARISHHRTHMADARRVRDETVAQARKSAGYLEQLLILGGLSEVESEAASRIFNDISLAHKNLRLYDDAILYARRSIEVARMLPNPQLHVSKGLSMLANMQRLTGDLDGALQSIRESRLNLETARFPSETARRSTWALVISREAKILGAPSGLGLGRPDEAIPLFGRAFQLIEEWAQDDPDSTYSRMLFATLGWEYGELLRTRDPEEALRVNDHSLLRVREVKNNSEARRGEAELLAGSSYSLRQLDRFGESKERIDEALRLLRETNDYPADRVEAHQAVHVTLRALGDHFAETGQPQKAVEVYQNLLDKIMMTRSDPRNDLGHAVALSQIYAALAALNGRNGNHDSAEMSAALRVELWRHWENRLPDNGLIRRQLEHTGVR